VLLLHIVVVILTPRHNDPAVKNSIILT